MNQIAAVTSSAVPRYSLSRGTLHHPSMVGRPRDGDEGGVAPSPDNGFQAARNLSPWRGLLPVVR